MQSVSNPGGAPQQHWRSTGLKTLITKNAPPQLEAVPIKQGGVALKEGAFEATATLLAEYE